MKAKRRTFFLVEWDKDGKHLSRFLLEGKFVGMYRSADVRKAIAVFASCMTREACYRVIFMEKIPGSQNPVMQIAARLERVGA